ncbi:MAG TPA: SDR family oxidoreductase [Candidatus Acidoferrales bacterium]|nr:SDR family oxidoreductase [Candidatus Acidoferrales bacterium]
MTGAKVLIITGASSGIGRALADRAVRAGYNVLAVARRRERLDELAASLAAAAASLATLALDLRTPQAAATIVNTALERFGRIDVIVNNAGSGAVGRASEQSDDALREQFETHVIVPVQLVREARAALQAARGQVFFVGSGVARIPIGNYGVYPPAKAAMRSVARILRNELRSKGIAVTYVDPGVVASEFHTRLGYRPPDIAVSPQVVACKILDAVATRPAVLNAVPWQTAAVTLGELLPAVVDLLLERFPSLSGAEPLLEVKPAEPNQALPQTAPIAPPVEEPAEEEAGGEDSPLRTALAPVASRMRRIKLSQAFVRSLLVPGSDLDPAEIALRWTGMPNKHERALVHDVLDALTESGFLERLSDSRYRVISAPAGEPPTGS